MTRKRQIKLDFVSDLGSVGVWYLNSNSQWDAPGQLRTLALQRSHPTTGQSSVRVNDWAEAATALGREPAPADGSASQVVAACSSSQPRRRWNFRVITGETRVTFGMNLMHTTSCRSQHMMYLQRADLLLHAASPCCRASVGLEATCHHCRLYRIVFLQFNL